MKKKKIGVSEFFYSNFKQSLSYIKETKKFIWFAFILFVLGSLAGILFPGLFEEQILKLIEEIIKKTDGLSRIGLMRFIIANNIETSFFAMILGVLFGLVPFTILLVNGYVLGFVINKTTGVEGLLILWRLFPHGIFEIPAVIISLALGFKIGSFLIFKVKKKRKIAGFIVALICFIVLFDLLIFLIFIPAKENMEIFYAGLFENPLIVIGFFIVILILFVLSSFIGTMFLPKKERKNIIEELKSRIKDSLRVFIFLVIPLLVIAGIIEGFLIALVG